MRVIVQVRPTRPSMLELGVMAIREVDAVDVEPLSETGFDPDPDYVGVLAPVPRTDVPSAREMTFTVHADVPREPDEALALIRGSIPDDEQRNAVVERLRARDDVLEVFSDPRIEALPICPGDPANYAGRRRRWTCRGVEPAG